MHTATSRFAATAVTLLALFSLTTGPSSAGAITASDRQALLSQLESSRAGLEREVAGLGRAAAEFKPAPERWSVAECLEHIAVVEGRLFDVIQNTVLAEPLETAQRVVEDEAVLRFFRDRGRKFQAPDPVQPARRWDSMAATMAAWAERRREVESYVRGTEVDLRSFALHNPAIEARLDAYQWFLLLSAHVDRHVAQIREIKGHPDFPAD